MRAAVGDRIVIKGHRQGEPERDGEVIEVRGEFGGPPYVVRWSTDGHEGVYFPGPDATIEHLGGELPTEAPPSGRPAVRDVMSTDVVVAHLDTPFEELVKLLLDHDIAAVPVVDAEGKLVGVVSEADLVSRAAYGHRRHRALQMMGEYLAGGDPQWLRKAAGDKASELMNAAPVTVTETQDVRRAARLMLERRVKRLVVVDAGQHVVGIVSRHDLLPALVEAAAG